MALMFLVLSTGVYHFITLKFKQVYSAFFTKKNYYLPPSNVICVAHVILVGLDLVFAATQQMYDVNDMSESSSMTRILDG